MVHVSSDPDSSMTPRALTYSEMLAGELEGLDVPDYSVVYWDNPFYGSMSDNEVVSDSDNDLIDWMAIKPTYNMMDPDHSFWWNVTRTSIEAMFKHSGKSYTESEQASQLRWWRDFAVPLLGPAPSSEHRVQSLLNWEGSPYRPSWNFCQDEATVRLGLDPTSIDLANPAMRGHYPELTGPDMAAKDPFRQEITRRLRTALRASTGAASADLSWFDKLTDSMFLTSEEELKLQSQWPANTPPPPLRFLAWGCKGNKREFKPYFHPFLKVAGTKKSVQHVIWEAALDLNASIGWKLSPALDIVMQYHQERADVMTPGMIGIDCVDPKKARLKVYAWAQSNTFSVMRDAMTLGGRKVDAETMRGVHILGEIWHLLLGTWDRSLIDSETIRKAVHGKEVDRATILSWEVRNGDMQPEVKIYLPLWVYHDTEQDAIDKLTEAFMILGWQKTADMYETAIKEAL